MRLSDQREYLDATVATTEGNFEVARVKWKTLLARARAESDTFNVVGLLQRLGDVEAEAANFDLAHSLHMEALQLDPSSPLPVLLYAKSLLHIFRRPDLARSRVADAQALLASLKPSEDELPKSWYEKEIHALVRHIERTKP